MASVDFDIRDGSIHFARVKRGFAEKSWQIIDPGITNDRYATASPCDFSNHRFIAYICSDGENDCIALLSLADKSWPVLWIKGSDFYMQPTWSSDGRYFSWVEWDHPHMAWQASRVMLAEIDPSDSRIITMRIVSGGESLPASQPQFSPDSRLLSFIRSNGEWEDLVLVDLEEGQNDCQYRRTIFTLQSCFQSERFTLMTGW
jgi:Tol biopolymer transport system component